jgi:hypothetical protein
MGHRILNRISRIFHAHNKPTTTDISQQQLDDDWSSQYDDKKEKKRWTATFNTKRIKRQSIIKDFFNQSAIDIQDTHRHHFIPYFHQEKVEHFDDEKVEIIVSSNSMNSFLSTTTKTSGYQIPSFYYSTPDLSSPNHSKITEHEETPRTSVDIESLQVIDEKPPGFGLATMVQEILGDAFSIADHEFFQEEQQHEP